MLKEHGFRPLRIAKHGTIWSDGSNRIMCPSTHKNDDPRSVKNWLKEFGRILERKKKVPTYESPSQTPMKILTTEPKHHDNGLRVPLAEIVLKKEEVVVQDSDIGTELGNGVYPKRYNPDQKESVSLAALKYAEQGMDYQAITNRLNAEGFRNAQGHRLSYHVVGCLLREVGYRRRKSWSWSKNNEKTGSTGTKININEVTVKAPEPAPVASPLSPDKILSAFGVQPSHSIPAFVVAILRDSGLSDTKKVRTLLALLEE